MIVASCNGFGYDNAFIAGGYAFGAGGCSRAKMT